MRVAVVVGLAVVLAGCAEGDVGGGEVVSVEAPEPDRVEEPEPAGVQPDSSAKVSCRHFRNVAGDASMLTDEELRGKIKEVHESAWVSENDGIAVHARSMLEAITAGDAEAFGSAVEEFGAACADLGL